MRKDVFNFYITKQLEFTGDFEMPIVKRILESELHCKYILATPFNYALSEPKPESKICHFYIDDYQFERCWREPELYISILKKFNAVIGSDFSMYTNLPRIQQIYNNWRNKVLMSYWQKQGIKVIPNIQWSDEKSFEYCFEGIEKHSLVAVSSTGCHGKAKEDFLKGYKKMCEILQPTKIIFVGNLHEELKEDERIIQVDSFMTQRRKIWAEEEAGLKMLDK